MVCDGFFTVCSTKNYSGKWQLCQKTSFGTVAILVVKLFFLLSPFFCYCRFTASCICRQCLVAHVDKE